MKGYVLGMAVGLGSFLMGLGLMSVVLPPDPAGPGRIAADVAVDAVPDASPSPFPSQSSSSLVAVIDRLDGMVRLAFHTTGNRAPDRPQPLVRNPVLAPPPPLPGPPGLGNRAPDIAPPPEDPELARAIARALAGLADELADELADDLAAPTDPAPQPGPIPGLPVAPTRAPLALAQGWASPTDPLPASAPAAQPLVPDGPGVTPGSPVARAPAAPLRVAASMAPDASGAPDGGASHRAAGRARFAFGTDPARAEATPLATLTATEDPRQDPAAPDIPPRVALDPSLQGGWATAAWISDPAPTLMAPTGFAPAAPPTAAETRIAALRPASTAPDTAPDTASVTAPAQRATRPAPSVGLTGQTPETAPAELPTTPGRVQPLADLPARAATEGPPPIAAPIAAPVATPAAAAPGPRVRPAVAGGGVTAPAPGASPPRAALTPDRPGAPAEPDRLPGRLVVQAPPARAETAAPGPEAPPLRQAQAPATVRALPGQAAAPRPGAGVRTDRLPQIGTAAPDPDPAPATPTAAPAAATPDDTGQPRFRRFAAATPTADHPRVGLVLIDPAEDPATEVAILALPRPVTIALPPFAADAPRRARAYAEAGHEIALSLDDVPALARAVDLEVLFATWLQDFPSALGVVDTQGSDARRARTLAPELMPLLRELGLGLIAPERGLSPFLNAARGAGVAHAGLWRSLDATEGDAAALGRILDRVAFEAQRQGQLAIAARADDPLLQDLLAEWLTMAATEGRAARASAVPVGAVLLLP